MGTSLITIGNHKLDFKNKNFEELTSEIKVKLSNTILPNEDFLKECIEKWYSGNDERNQSILANIKLNNDWTHLPENDYYRFETDKQITIFGPHDLEIDFYPNKLVFMNPYDRYWQWLAGGNRKYTNKWRTYFFHVLKLFGGNRVIYLADNSHPLDKYTEFTCPFTEIEHAMFNDLGAPRSEFKLKEKDYNNSYFIDKFEDRSKGSS